MACAAPIELQLGIRKPSEFPIEEQPELKKPKSESAEQEEEDDEVSIEEDENDQVSIEEDENDEVSTEEDENDEVPKVDEDYWDEYGLHEIHQMDPWECVQVLNCSIFATEKQNKEKGINYEYYRLVRVNEETVTDVEDYFTISGFIYYITYLAEDLNNKLDSGSCSLENVHVGPHGGQLIELQAKVFLSPQAKVFLASSDEDDNKKIELMYFNVKDTLSDEGVKSHMELQAYKKKLAVTK